MKAKKHIAIFLLLIISAGCALTFPEKKDELFSTAASYEKDGEYWYAYVFYEEYLRRYPESEKSEIALARMYEIGLKKWKTGWGNEKLVNLVENYPAAILAHEAIFKVGEYRFLNEYYDDAQLAFEMLVRNYPESERVEAGLFMWGESELGLYQGKEYESIPLRKAQTQFKKLLQHFPSGAYAEKASKRLRQIIDELASREYLRALYYMKHGKYKSTKVYLESIRKNYPETEYAERAERLLESIETRGD